MQCQTNLIIIVLLKTQEGVLAHPAGSLIRVCCYESVITPWDLWDYIYNCRNHLKMNQFSYQHYFEFCHEIICFFVFLMLSEWVDM